MTDPSARTAEGIARYLEQERAPAHDRDETDALARGLPVLASHHREHANEARACAKLIREFWT